MLNFNLLSISLFFENVASLVSLNFEITLVRSSYEHPIEQTKQTVKAKSRCQSQQRNANQRSQAIWASRASKEASQLFSQLASQPTNQLTNQPINQPTNLLTNQPTSQPASQPTNRRADLSCEQANVRGKQIINAKSSYLSKQS